MGNDIKMLNKYGLILTHGVECLVPEGMTCAGFYVLDATDKFAHLVRCSSKDANVSCSGAVI